MPEDIETIRSGVAKIKNDVAAVTKNTQQASESAKIANENLATSARHIQSLANKFRGQLNRQVQSSLNDILLEGKSFRSTLGKFGKNFIDNIKERSLNTNPFSRITPFAQGGIINRPTLFPLGGRSAALAGESGTEAILPLTRTANGNLGVQAQAGRQININIQTPNPSSFQQSQTQLAAQLRHALARGDRNR